VNTVFAFRELLLFLYLRIQIFIQVFGKTLFISYADNRDIASQRLLIIITTNNYSSMRNSEATIGQKLKSAKFGEGSWAVAPAF
jgi:hypothetical protein